MYNRIKKLCGVGIVVSCLCLFALPVGAVEAPPETVNLVNPIGGTTAKPQGTTDINEIVGTAIKMVTGIMGSLALLVFVYGGFLWLTSAGNGEKVQKGTSAMLWAAVGIFIIFSSYAILTLVFKGLSGA